MTARCAPALAAWCLWLISATPLAAAPGDTASPRVTAVPVVDRDAGDGDAEILSVGGRFQTAVYRARVGPRAVRGTVTWTLPTGFREVAVPYEGLAFGAFRSSQGTVEAGIDGAGRLRITPGGDETLEAGEITVEADWSAPLVAEGAGRRLSAALPPAVTSRVIFVEMFEDVSIAEATGLKRVGDSTRVLELGAAGDLSVLFKNRPGRSSARGPVVGGVIATTVSDAGLVHRATLKLSCPGGGGETLRIQLAPGEILAFDDGTVSFAREGGEAVVAFDEPLGETPRTLAFTVTSAVSVEASRRFSLPVPLDGVPFDLRYALAVRDGWDFRDLETTGLEATSGDRIDEDALSILFDVTAPSPSVSLAVGERDGVVRAGAVHRLFRTRSGVFCESTFEIATASTPRHEVAVDVPAGWRPVSVRSLPVEGEPTAAGRVLAWRGGPFGRVAGKASIALPFALRAGRGLRLSLVARSVGATPPTGPPSVSDAEIAATRVIIDGDPPAADAGDEREDSSAFGVPPEAVDDRAAFRELFARVAADRGILRAVTTVELLDGDLVETIELSGALPAGALRVADAEGRAWSATDKGEVRSEPEASREDIRPGESAVRLIYDGPPDVIRGVRRRPFRAGLAVAIARPVGGGRGVDSSLVLRGDAIDRVVVLDAEGEPVPGDDEDASGMLDADGVAVAASRRFESPERDIRVTTVEPGRRFHPPVARGRWRLAPAPSADVRELSFPYRPDPLIPGAVVPLESGHRLESGYLLAGSGGRVPLSIEGDRLGLPDIAGEVFLLGRGVGGGGLLVDRHEFPRPFPHSGGTVFDIETEVSEGAWALGRGSDASSGPSFAPPRSIGVVRRDAFFGWALAVACGGFYWGRCFAGAASRIGARSGAAASTVLVAIAAAGAVALCVVLPALAFEGATVASLGAACGLRAFGLRRRLMRPALGPTSPDELPRPSTVIVHTLVGWTCLWAGAAAAHASPDGGMSRQAAGRGGVRFLPAAEAGRIAAGLRTVVESARYDVRPLGARAFAVDARFIARDIGPEDAGAWFLEFDGLVLRGPGAVTVDGSDAVAVAVPGGLIVRRQSASGLDAVGDRGVAIEISAAGDLVPGDTEIAFRGPPAADTRVRLTGFAGLDDVRFGPGAIVGASSDGGPRADRGAKTREVGWVTCTPIVFRLPDVTAAPPGEPAAVAETVEAVVTVGPELVRVRYAWSTTTPREPRRPAMLTVPLPAGATLLPATFDGVAETRSTPETVTVTFAEDVSAASFEVAWRTADGPRHALEPVLPAAREGLTRRIAVFPAPGFRFSERTFADGADTLSGLGPLETLPTVVTGAFAATVTVVPAATRFRCDLAQTLTTSSRRDAVAWTVTFAESETAPFPLMTRWRPSEGLEPIAVTAARDGASRLVDWWFSAGVLTVVTSDRSPDTAFRIEAVRERSPQAAGVEGGVAVTVPTLMPLDGVVGSVRLVAAGDRDSGVELADAGDFEVAGNRTPDANGPLELTYRPATRSGEPPSSTVLRLRPLPAEIDKGADGGTPLPDETPGGSPGRVWNFVERVDARLAGKTLLDPDAATAGVFFPDDLEVLRVERSDRRSADVIDGRLRIAPADRPVWTAVSWRSRGRHAVLPSSLAEDARETAAWTDGVAVAVDEPLFGRPERPGDLPEAIRAGWATRFGESTGAWRRVTKTGAGAVAAWSVPPETSLGRPATRIALTTIAVVTLVASCLAATVRRDAAAESAGG